jgi:hypothetical protein
VTAAKIGRRLEIATDDGSRSLDDPLQAARNLKNFAANSNCGKKIVSTFGQRNLHTTTPSRNKRKRSEVENWYCSRCRRAGAADATEDAGNRQNWPKNSLDGSLGEREDETLLKESYYFDDLFMSRTDHLQLDDRSIERRMSQIDDLILQVAASYTTKELNFLPNLDFDLIENRHPELARTVRSAFGVAAVRPLAEELLVLGIHEWRTMDIFRAIIAVSVQNWVLHSWLPECLSPDGPVQTVLKAGYKTAQERGNSSAPGVTYNSWSSYTDQNLRRNKVPESPTEVLARCDSWNLRKTRI